MGEYLLSQQVNYINYLCEHQYFLYGGNFKDERFIKNILDLYNKYNAVYGSISKLVEHIPLFLYIEFLYEFNDDFGIYNLYFKDMPKEQCLNLIIKDCHNKYKEK